MYRTSGGVVLEIRGSPSEFEYYTRWVKPLFDAVVGIKATPTRREYRGGHVIGIRSSKKEVFLLFHRSLGFPLGKKSRTVRVPRIIIRNADLWSDYVRGVFDTDGSIYLRRVRKNRAYRHPVVDIFTSSAPHKAQLHNMIRKLGFNCWLEKNKVRMAGWSTVKRFFAIIKPHNQVHMKRFNDFYTHRGYEAHRSHLTDP